MTDEKYIDIAIEISKNAKYPYGAIVVKDGKIIGRSDDKTLMETSMYSHAELEAIESASKNKNLYGDLNRKQAEYVNDIKISATHLLGMINEVLDMSKIEARAMKIVKSTFWISRAVDEVCNIVAPLAEKKHIALIKNLEADLQEVKGKVNNFNLETPEFYSIFTKLLKASMEEYRNEKNYCI